MMRFFAFWMALAMLSGCALPPGWRGDSITQTYSLDGVKLISPDYPNGNHPATFTQTEYEVSPTRRLLLRYESFHDQVNDVDLTGGKTVLFEIAVVDPERLNDAQAELKICPVTQNWMMLASWHAPFYGPGGRWQRPGGDYDELGCLEGKPKDLAPIPDAKKEPVLVFDATRWFIDYARGRKEDFGMIVIAKSSVRLVGDLSGTYSPRIRFHKF